MSLTGARQDLQTIQQSVAAGSVVVASTGTGPFEQILLDGRHALHADEPVPVGGSDAGPGPYELMVRGKIPESDGPLGMSSPSDTYKQDRDPHIK
jgi:hypothetical protein